MPGAIPAKDVENAWASRPPTTDTRARTAHGQRTPTAAAVHYRIEAPDPHQHLFHVTLTVARPASAAGTGAARLDTGQLPGARVLQNLQNLQAHQDRQAVALQQLDKHRWLATCQPGRPLVLRYAVYACDASVRTAWLDAARGFFNATSLCLRAEGHTEQPCTIDIVAPEK